MWTYTRPSSRNSLRRKPVASSISTTALSRARVWVSLADRTVALADLIRDQIPAIPPNSLGSRSGVTAPLGEIRPGDKHAEGAAPNDDALVVGHSHPAGTS